MVGEQQKELDYLINNNTNYLRTIDDLKEFIRMAENDLS